MVKRETYINQLNGRILLADELIQEIQEIIPLSYQELHELSLDGISESTKESVRERVREWFQISRVLIEAGSGKDDYLVQEFIHRGSKPIRELDFKKAMVGKLESGKRGLESIVQACEIQRSLVADTKTELHPVSDVRPCKVFISHKKEDQDYADALVSLINFIIGSSGDKVFCSSIPGYGIRQSRDIIDDLKAQFDEHNIFMVIIHSPRYYNSTICLNEMGASWILGTKFSSFMTKDCTYDLLNGVIGKEKICININEERGMLNAHLNDFKNDLLSFFGVGAIDENKWEHARDRFVKEVSMLSYASTGDDSSSEPPRNESVARFTNEENAIIKKWVDSNFIEGHVVRTKDGTSFILGQDSYDVKGARDLMKWNDFMDRMEKAKLIKTVRTNRMGNPVFQLTRIAFDYIDSLS